MNMIKSIAAIALFATNEVKGDMQMFSTLNLKQDLISSLKMLNAFKPIVLEEQSTLDIDLDVLGEEGDGEYTLTSD